MDTHSALTCMAAESRFKRQRGAGVGAARCPGLDQLDTAADALEASAKQAKRMAADHEQVQPRWGFPPQWQLEATNWVLGPPNRLRASGHDMAPNAPQRDAPTRRTLAWITS